ncbi:hypothetical protein A2U01_0026771, partial [Trifolium medium]|nr:hypothetical protein [Trifolium medium]
YLKRHLKRKPPTWMGDSVSSEDLNWMGDSVSGGGLHG